MKRWQKAKQENTANPPIIFSEDLIKGLFEKNSDVQFETFHFGRSPSFKVLFTYCEGMVNTEGLSHFATHRLNEFFIDKDLEDVTEDTISKNLFLPSIKWINDKDQLISDIFTGRVAIFIEGYPFLFSIDLIKRPQRQPEETNMEMSVKGPRDNLIEDISINMALIRKRLPTNSLCSEKLVIGKRSRTNVCVVYIKDVANPTILQALIKKLKAIDIEGIINGTQLMELVFPKSLLFPYHDYSARPDYIVRSLLSGRIVILIDGIPYSIITPVNLFLLLKSAEDFEYAFLYNSLERLMRITGLLVAGFLPAFWVALTLFHQDQIPLPLLATIIESRKGVPMPAFLEAIIMLVLFELFREAGLRLPAAIGQTLSVVGGLIIGDAAISAGITSPSMLVVVAASSVATFTLVNQSLIGTITIIRVGVLIFSSFFGFFGFFLSLFLIVLMVANIRIFGVPYMELATKISISNILKATFRLPASLYKTRPPMFDSKDKTRMGDDDQS
ncbi:spore germination protein [Heyndrickxia sp. NPDC080065]|uniref:spore germination protein n=1 Tax=Heyndrickxia sp. NPDC080065 TaxID=3390568 RepID=UPI003CFC6C80